MSIALKEANETSYWLELLYRGNYLPSPQFELLQSDNEELIKLLVAIVKTTKAALQSG